MGMDVRMVWSGQGYGDGQWFGGDMDIEGTWVWKGQGY